MNHDQTVKRWITRAIATCKWIPAERDKRAAKIAGYVETVQQRDKNQEETARTIRDLQEQVQRLQEENQRLKERKPLITKVLQKIRK